MLGDIEAGRHSRAEFADYIPDVASENGVVPACHSHIGKKRRSPRQDASVRGLHMGMGPDHRRNSAVEEPRHRRFLAGRFGMKIHNDALDCPGNLRQDLFHRLKRTICALLHENFAHERNDRDFAACGIAEDVPPFSRLQGAQIRGAHQIFDGKNLCFKVFLIPHVISRGQYIGNFHVFDT